MNQQDLGRKLKKARELAGLSQQDAADMLELPRTAVTQMEGGNRSVSTLELTRLSGLYHQPVSYFLEETDDEEGEDMLVALYRIAPGLSEDPEVKEQVNRHLDWCREGYNLEQILGRDHRMGPPTYSESIPRTVGEAVSQGAKIADQERKRLSLGHAPIPDMSELINEQNIWASGADFPDSISGLFLSHPSIGLAIFVNSGHTRARKRFSYAHEYAHALLDRDMKVTVSQRGNASELVEKRANAFAAAFLMPAGGIAALLKSLDKGRPSKEEIMVFDVATNDRIDTSIRSNASDQRITYQDVAILGNHFGVSYQAATYRLRSLNHISPKECNELLDKVDVGREYLEVLDMFDDLTDEEDQKIINRELRGHIVHLAIEAYRREEISRGKLLDLGKSLEIPSDKLLNLAEAACAN
ncbi:MAG: ImmA/IrrE family metallo-endopeptidase [Rhodospirillales bacterium]|nr:ImmA/IrrE family metallo-endopeptidase [Rhodospirillales bacterium]MCB9994864.1 ImmA/IrrE family metallo-endopeptidase [Rhodospirillales bacterium]